MTVYYTYLLCVLSFLFGSASAFLAYFMLWKPQEIYSQMLEAKQQEAKFRERYALEVFKSVSLRERLKYILHDIGETDADTIRKIEDLFFGGLEQTDETADFDIDTTD